MEHTKTQPLKTRFLEYLDIIGVPFVFTRLALQIAGYLSLIFPPNTDYPLYQGRDWFFTPVRVLDIWARWDTGWYYLIATEGYTPNPDVMTIRSNIAFFPLYPLLVRLASLFAIDFSEHRTWFVIFALLVSNLCFLGGLVLTVQICRQLKFDRSTILSVIWIMLLYPYSFFFSAAYSESVFLLFLVAAFYFTIQENWLLAAISGAFLALTRPPGLLVLLPIGIRYLIATRFRIKLKHILYFLIIPIFVSLFLFHTYTITGDFFAPFNNQLAWGKIFKMPWTTILEPNYWRPVIHDFDLAFTFVALLLLAGYFLLKLPYFEWAVYALILVISPLFYGVLQSNGRYSAIALPMYFTAGILIRKNERLRVAVFVLLAMIQALLFAGWARGYLVV